MEDSKRLYTQNENNSGFAAESDEVSLVAIFRIIKSNILWILAVGAVLAILTAIGTKLFVTPTYRSYSSMYVYSNVDTSGTITNAELQAAENLADTYVQILKSRSISKLAWERTKATYDKAASLSLEAFQRMVSVGTVNGTQILRVTATSEDPYLSEAIANAYADIAPREITRITRVGGVEIIDYAEASMSPIGSNLVRNTGIALVVGVALTALFFVLRTLLDTTVYTKEDVEETTDVPVLGTIPEILVSNGKHELWVAVEKEYLGNDN